MAHAAKLSARTNGRRVFGFKKILRQKADQTWFRGDYCNFGPTKPALDRLGAKGPEQFVLQGWLPPRPLIGPETKLVAFGSCFAENIANWLAERNFNILTRKDGPNSDSYVVRFGEGMVNTFAIRQQFEWAFEGKTCSEELWHGYDAQAFGYDEQVRVKTRAVFDQAEIFIVTLGLSEVWYDEVTGGVFWRAIPFDKYDSSRHKFRVSSVAENKANIQAILRLIRQYRPDAKIIMTLSPVPLVATFRPVSCVSANYASKAILRAALDEVIREDGPQDDFYYWPSYELVMDFFDNCWNYDRRHVKREILDFIMVLFERHWCHGTSAKMTLAEALLRARIAEGAYPKRFAKLLEAGDWAAAARWIGTSGQGLNSGIEVLLQRVEEMREENGASCLLSELQALRESQEAKRERRSGDDASPALST